MPRQVKHELPGLWFASAGSHALLHHCTSSCTQLDDGGVLARHLQPLLDKLTRPLEHRRGRCGELMKRVKDHEPGAPAGGAAALRAHWLSALTRRRRVRMRYYVRSRREHTERTVSAAAPRALAQHL
jgi:hypothetical protein